MDLDKLLARAWPDPLIKLVVRAILKRKVKTQKIADVEKRRDYMDRFVENLKTQSIALHTADANEQHYELPPAFFQKILGKYLKYSCGYWPSNTPLNKASLDLDRSEEDMLALTCRRAEIGSGQKILDLGCGWGSTALYMARKYPGAEITAVSNSRLQICHIEKEAKNKGYSNLKALKADINDLELTDRFDRVVSVEMFEHMRNYEALLEKISCFIKPGGKLFIHIFTHHTYPFLYENLSGRDWMARHFFTGGTMPSADLLHYFLSNFFLQKQWAVSGRHYRYTLEAWLQKMDRQREEIYPLFIETYGQEEAEKWWNYWRLFFLSCAEFFGYNSGNEWYVSHYLLKKR